MSKNQKLSVILGGLLLLVWDAASAHAQPERRQGPDTFKRGDYVAKPGEVKSEDSNAQQMVYELRCRGGENAFQLTHALSIVGRDQHTHYIFNLDFSGGKRPARRDGSALEPGTCSWIDRTLSASEPRQISFDARPLLIDIGRAQEDDKRTAVSEYFNDPGHFWSFFVYNTGEGKFQSTRHKLWADPRKVGVDERPRNNRLVVKP